MTTEKPGRPEKRPRNRAASMRALMDAGVELFSTEGYDAATTKRIARRAGLNEQLITRYFGGKAGLLVAIFEDFLTRQDDDARYTALPPLPTPEEEIERFLLFRDEHIRRTEKLVSILLSRLLVDPKVRKRLNRAVVRNGQRALAARLADLKAAGKIEPHVDVDQVAASVVLESLGISFLARTISGVDDARTLNHLVAFANQIGRGISAASPPPDRP